MFALCFTSAAATDLRRAQVRKTTRKQTNPAIKAARVGLAALAIVLAAASPSFAGKNGGNGGGNGNRSGGSSFRVQSNNNFSQSMKSFNQSTPKFTQSNPTFTQKFTPRVITTPKLNTQGLSNGSITKNQRITTPKFTQQNPINLGIKVTDIKRGNSTTPTLNKKIGIADVVKKSSPVLTLPGGKKVLGVTKDKPFVQQIDPIFSNNGKNKHNGNSVINGKHNDCHDNGKKHCNNWNWCWKQHCKPSCYKPCHQNWHCYTYPKWCGLHRHTCGYYVNVPVIVVQGIDLQLLAIRAADSGDPSQNLGPRFRVWLRNNTPYAVLKPFNVLVLAGRDAIPTADLPQAGVRIEAMQPGQILPVDVRLPVQANDVNLATIHVLVDSHREILEVFEDNNGIVLPRGEVMSVDPALLATDVQTAVPGAEINVAGEGLGVAAGQVIVKLAGLDLAAEVVGWSELGLRIKLPVVQIVNPVDAQIIAIRADGKQINPLPIKVVPGEVQISAQPAVVQPVSAVTTTTQDVGAVQAMFGN